MNKYHSKKLGFGLCLKHKEKYHSGVWKLHWRRTKFKLSAVRTVLQSYNCTGSTVARTVQGRKRHITSVMDYHVNKYCITEFVKSAAKIRPFLVTFKKTSNAYLLI